MPTWPGIIQVIEEGQADERPVADDGDLIVVQVPVKAQYEYGDTRMMRCMECVGVYSARRRWKGLKNVRSGVLWYLARGLEGLWGNEVPGYVVKG